MKIELHLFASLAEYMPPKAEDGSNFMQTDEGVTINNVLSQLGVPEEAVQIVFVNGIISKVDDVLNDGDRLGVFPAVAGG
jgi:sulfur carrier protein ThiS